MNLQRRPLVLGSLAALATPQAVLAQSAAGKVWRIGVLSESVSPGVIRLLLAQTLAALGYTEGRDLTIDVKFAQSKADLLPRLAAELLAAKPDLLIGLLNREIIALKQATTTIPIVMMYAGAPVELGLIASLARPGGNITGTTTLTAEMVGKQTQILRETIPNMSRLARLTDVDSPGFAFYEQYFDLAAQSFRLRVSKFPIRTAADVDAAFASLERDRPDAMMVGASGVVYEQRGRIIEFATRHKLPAHHSIRESVVQGGLMSYTANFVAMAQRNAWMIDKIFKGAKPSDIPVEEPARFHFVINMKTAKAMGLVIPPTVLLQATELIE